MDISKLEIGAVFKNYKELCKFIGEPVKGGDAKKKQLKNWKNYFEWNQEKYKFKITKIKQKQTIIKENSISEEEFVERFANSIQKERYKQSNINSSLRQTILKEAGRYCDIEYDKSTKRYNIIREYEYPVPKKMIYMKKSLYKYIIPLLLLKIKDEHDENNKIILSTKGVGRYIDMYNKNFNIIKDNYSVACSKDVKDKNIIIDNKYKFGFDHYNLDDYYAKAEDMIKYYIKNSLKMLKEIGAINYTEVKMVMYISKEDEENAKKPDFFVDDEVRKVHMFKYKPKVKFRVATDEENDLCINLERETDEECHINTKEHGIQKRYFGEKSAEWMSCFANKLKKYSEDLDYTIIGFCDFYEIFSGEVSFCNDCLTYFEDYEDINLLVDRFNEEFSTMLVDKAIQRKTIGLHKYNDNYIQDFTNLAGITIYKDIEEDIQEIIDDNPLKYTTEIHNY